MKNILIVVQGKKFPESAFEFAYKLNEQSPVSLTALVFPQMVHIENWAAYSAASAGTLVDPAVETNTHRLMEWSKEHHINCAIHHGSMEQGVSQIIKESRFADLILVADDSFYKEEGSTILDAIKDVMHHSECPVMVIPENVSFPEHLLFAYDGSQSSMAAIKQFTYLFPEFRTLDSIFLHMGKDDIDIPYKENIAQWITGYFPNHTFVNIRSDADEYFGSGVKSLPTLVIAGAFGRTALSQWLHPSFADDLVSKYRVPLFVYHAS